MKTITILFSMTLIFQQSVLGKKSGRKSRFENTEQGIETANINNVGKFRDLDVFHREFQIEQEQNSALAIKNIKGRKISLKGVVASVETGSGTIEYNLTIVSDKTIGEREEGSLGATMAVESAHLICPISSEQISSFKKGDAVFISGFYSSSRENFYLFRDCSIKKAGTTNQIGVIAANLANRLEILNIALRAMEPPTKAKNKALKYRETILQLGQVFKQDQSKCQYQQLAGGSVGNHEAKLKLFLSLIKSYYEEYPSAQNMPEFSGILESWTEVIAICDGKTASGDDASRNGTASEASNEN